MYLLWLNDAPVTYISNAERTPEDEFENIPIFCCFKYKKSYNKLYIVMSFNMHINFAKKLTAFMEGDKKYQKYNKNDMVIVDKFLCRYSIC